MPLPELGRWLLAGLFTAVVGWAAVSDARSRKIPNWTVLAIVGLFAPWAFLAGPGWALWALAAGAGVLVVCFLLYLLGLFGAGDAKLFAAVALFAGLGHLAALAIDTALIGGAIALASVITAPRRALVMFQLRAKPGDANSGVPYGVAIALGGAIVVWGGLLNLPGPFGGVI